MSDAAEVPRFTPAIPLFKPESSNAPRQTPLERSLGALAEKLGIEKKYEPLRVPLGRLEPPLHTPASLDFADSPLPQDLDAEAVTRRLTACVAKDLNKGELRLYRTLHTVALRVAKRNGYSPAVSRVTFFCPQEVMAHALGVCRQTVWRQLKLLLELGLVDVRPHKTTHRGQTVNDGYLWCVRLHPHRGKAPRLTYEELKTKYRDLSADVEAGRTAYALLNPAADSEMQQSYSAEKGTANIELLLGWTLHPLESSIPVSSDCCKNASVALESVLDVAHADRQGRGAAVDIGARAICSALDDHGSHRFYCRLLWNLLRRKDQGQDYFHAVYEMVLRARADNAEGFARSAGALFVSRLKAWEVWDWLEATPMVRVGMTPYN